MYSRLQRDPLATVSLLDVGQGDAVHVRLIDGTDILIDAGPDVSVLDELGSTMPHFDRDLEYVILSHSDADHVTGFVEVLDRYHIFSVLETGVRAGSFIDEVFYSKARLIHGYSIMQAGDTIEVYDDVFLTALFPSASVSSNDMSRNNRSLVVRLDVGDVSFLFTGDIEREAEEMMLQLYASDLSWLDVDVLKVAHHGSASSTSFPFLESVSPEIALISVGAENRFGHPHMRTLRVFEDQDVSVWRTDQHGRIRCTTDGLEVFCRGNR